MANRSTLVAVFASVMGVMVTGCTSRDVGTQASLAGGRLTTAGLADQKLVVTYDGGADSIEASGPGASDFIDLDGHRFYAHSTYPEATSIVELPDGTRLVANDTGDVEIELIELTDADGRTQVVRGFRRGVSAPIQAEATRLSQVVVMADQMSADQAAQFVEYMDAAKAWAATFGDLADAARAVFAARLGL
ncbi:MAG: hypothetical protein AAGI30_14335 [Planctomycetota bacterium]